MNLITKLVKHFSRGARESRGAFFRASFTIDENSKILDLGSENGSNIVSVLRGTQFQPANVYIADIHLGLVESGSKEHGFTPVHLDESEGLPFTDKFFDIVYCSSVIEHVTMPKDQIWSTYSGRKFKVESLKRQREFAEEIKRIGKQYFVQTPYRHFPIESHSWLPFMSWLPRWLQIPILRVTNTIWVKRTNPDWNLLDKKEMLHLFDDAQIHDEKLFGLTKSIMAVRVHERGDESHRESMLTLW